MGFHPNDKRSQVIRSKTHTTFFIFLLDKVKYFRKEKTPHLYAKFFRAVVMLCCGALLPAPA